MGQKTKSKNEDQLDGLVDYCGKHPELRFWQALRNWSGYGFILKADALDVCDGEGLYYEGLDDTFYIK